MTVILFHLAEHYSVTLTPSFCTSGKSIHGVFGDVFGRKIGPILAWE